MAPDYTAARYNSLTKMLLLLPAMLISGALVAAQPEQACTRWEDCRQLALDAAAREDFETFHTLAWRAVQTGPRNDADLMFMLARAQALSGRPDDALVMLGRLADRGVPHPEAETLDDFSRVREMRGWPALLERLHGAIPSTTLSTPPTSPKVVLAERPPSPSSPAPPSPPATPKTPAARASAASPAAPAASKLPAAPPASEAPAAPAPSAPASPVMVPLDGISLIPPTVGAPLALAYDRVSARTIIADDSSGTLRVLSDLSGNVVNLVSPGWGGGYHSNALVIDSKRGDLWVAGTRNADAPESVLHHLQLISGRILYSVPAPTDAGATRFVAVALSSASVFVLDAEGGRIFELGAGAKTLRVRMAMPQRDLTGLAMASDTVAYVTHGGGILRIDLATKRIEPVKAAAGLSLEGIEWISSFDNSLVAVQHRPDGQMAAVRYRFDRSGRTVAKAETFGTAAAKGGAVLGNVFYFVAALPAGTAVARVNLR